MKAHLQLVSVTLAVAMTVVAAHKPIHDEIKEMHDSLRLLQTSITFKQMQLETLYALETAAGGGCSVGSSPPYPPTGTTPWSTDSPTQGPHTQTTTRPRRPTTTIPTPTACTEYDRLTYCPSGGECRIDNGIYTCDMASLGNVTRTTRNVSNECSHVIDVDRVLAFEMDHQETLDGYHALGKISEDNLHSIVSIGYANAKMLITRIKFLFTKEVRLTQFTSKQMEKRESYVLHPYDHVKQIEFLSWPRDTFALFSAEDGTNLTSWDITYLKVYSCSGAEMAEVDRLDAECQRCNGWNRPYDYGNRCGAYVSCDDRNGIVRQACSNLNWDDSCKKSGSTREDSRQVERIVDMVAAATNE